MNKKVLEPVYQNIHSALIKKCRDGDSESQFELYKLYYKAMYNTSLRIVNNKTDAEDIMQDSFLAAFRKIHTYSGSVSFGSWLKKIVINKSIDHIKMKKLVLIDSLEEGAEMQDNGHYDEEFEIDPTTDPDEIIGTVKKYLEQLPEGYKLITTLYLIEGYDHEEIGQILGISSSTSRSQFMRARKKLSEMLKKSYANT